MSAFVPCIANMATKHDGKKCGKCNSKRNENTVHLLANAMFFDCVGKTMCDTGRVFGVKQDAAHLRASAKSVSFCGVVAARRGP